MNCAARWSAVLVVIGALSLGNTASAADKTERVWKSKCSSCHGTDGKGQTEKGKKLKVADYTDAAWQKSRTDDQLRKAITDGFKGEKDGVKQEMDGYKADLSAEQIDALIKFTRSLGGK